MADEQEIDRDEQRRNEARKPGGGARAVTHLVDAKEPQDGTDFTTYPAEEDGPPAQTSRPAENTELDVP